MHSDMGARGSDWSWVTGLLTMGTGAVPPICKLQSLQRPTGTMSLKQPVPPAPARALITCQPE